MQHYNRNLPPVDIKIVVYYEDSWIKAIRRTWSRTAEGQIEFHKVPNEVEVFSVHSSNLKWKYY